MYRETVKVLGVRVTGSYMEENKFSWRTLRITDGKKILCRPHSLLKTRINQNPVLKTSAKLRLVLKADAPGIKRLLFPN